ncbi:MAG TPA: DNA translocase FtsK 4TM domain-containing protein [Micropepsaceae bacterium]|nr:DNA translocase FtsK 4TM domain-containing protein [Micropepsaceae bacterium]
MHRWVGVYQPRSRKARFAEAVEEAREWFAQLLRQTLLRVLGLGLVLGASAWLAALLSYDSTDPSFNNATARTAANWLGSFGAYGADFFLQALGAAAIALALPIAACGWQMMTGTRPARLWWRVPAAIVGGAILAAGLGSFPDFSLLPAGMGGAVGQLSDFYANKWTASLEAAWLVYVIPPVLLLAGSALILTAGGIRWAAVKTVLFAVAGSLWAAGSWLHQRFSRRRMDEVEDEDFEAEPGWDEEADADAESEDDDVASLDVAPERFEPRELPGRRVQRDERRRKGKAKAGSQPALNLAEGEYQLPPLGLLSEPPVDTAAPAFSDDALEENARLLEAVLSDFGVRGRIVAVRPGPVVTLYELEPAAGVKSSRVISLSDDIARSMSAVAARVAVIPGRNVIGIELPNQKRETVYLRELFSASEYEKSRAPLTLALGKTIGGEPVMADLAKMPHLLIAGTTGSGKSVALNTMILSLLYRMPPEHCRLIMIDPKMLELSVYDEIPHLLAPVVTDPKKAVVALKWAVREMEQRYAKMAKIGARGVEAFNERVKKARDKGEVLKRTVQTGFDRETGRPVYEDEILELEPMPYIVVVVDEMADLMMISGKEIEGAVQRLAQMARAAGIHLIAATQRPSVDVITGTIKANFPTRISFQVTSKIDSRTILGEQGAEQLLGQGDMLYMMAGGRIRRVHGPFVSDSEVEDVVRYLKTQGRPDYLDAVTEEPDEDDDDPYALYGNGEGGDDLFDKAIAIVARERKVSTSYVQRRLQIGYNRAARLIERMEEEGMISKPNHQGKREILLPEGRE